MLHPERKEAKTIDMPGRCRAFTDAVYGGPGHTPRELATAQNAFDPPAPAYTLYCGEMHGHTDLSDGSVDIDTYYRHFRDELKLDFAALSDHDHGGVGKDELWVGSPSKWDLMKAKVKEYYVPGRFTTLLAYERDSYPYYNNLVVYYRSHDGDMLRGGRDGEFTKAELATALLRPDVLLVPHDPYSLSAGAGLSKLEPSLMTSLLELYSCGDSAEYYGNPLNVKTCVRGGFWQDALARGARMGCIGGGDNHNGKGGTVLDAPYPENYLGLTGVWAEANTVEGIFEALKSRRCYAFTGAPFSVDFRINGHYMGEELDLPAEDDRSIHYRIEADVSVRSVTVIKNNQELVRVRRETQCTFFDYEPEKDTDWYYLRVELEDGRFAWTSPIWITKK